METEEPVLLARLELTEPGYQSSAATRLGAQTALGLQLSLLPLPNPSHGLPECCQSLGSFRHR